MTQEQRNYYIKANDAMKKFRDAFYELESVWQDDQSRNVDLNEIFGIDYPFNQSFDEINVGKWVDNACYRLFDLIESKYEPIEYFLIGDHASGIYTNDGFTELVDAIKNNEVQNGWRIALIDKSKHSVEHIIDEFKNADEYVEITKEQYEMLWTMQETIG